GAWRDPCVAQRRGEKQEPRMRRLRPAVVVSVAVFLASASACRPKEDAGVVHLYGRLEAPSVDLSPKVAGRVAAVAGREGDRVKAGDVLVRLDLGETTLAVKRDAEGVKAAQAHVKDMEVGNRRAEIAAAEAEVQDRRAAVELAKKELERRRSLLEKKVGSQEDYDTAK